MAQLDRCGLPSWPRRAHCPFTAQMPAGESLSDLFLSLISPVLQLFWSPPNRSLELVYQRSENMKGIPLFRFVAPKTLFANGTDYAPNEGFCPCRQSGLLNVSSCRHSESDSSPSSVWKRAVFVRLIICRCVLFNLSTVQTRRSSSPILTFSTPTRFCWTTCRDSLQMKRSMASS